MFKTLSLVLTPVLCILGPTAHATSRHQHPKEVAQQSLSSQEAKTNSSPLVPIWTETNSSRPVVTWTDRFGHVWHTTMDIFHSSAEVLRDANTYVPVGTAVLCYYKKPRCKKIVADALSKMHAH